MRPSLAGWPRSSAAPSIATDADAPRREALPRRLPPARIRVHLCRGGVAGGRGTIPPPYAPAACALPPSSSPSTSDASADRSSRPRSCSRNEFCGLLSLLCIGVSLFDDEAPNALSSGNRTALSLQAGSAQALQLQAAPFTSPSVQCRLTIHVLVAVIARIAACAVANRRVELRSARAARERALVASQSAGL